MLNRKVNEFQTAVKKFVTRLLILAAIVVFGAIAIAQAPRNGHNTAKEPNGVPEPFTEDAKPLQNVSSLVTPAAYNEPESNGFAASDSEPNADSLRTDIDTASMVDTYDETVQPASDVYEAADYNDLPLPDADEYSHTDTYATESEYTDSYEAAPPLLDDEPIDSKPVRSNPYRNESAEYEQNQPKPNTYEVSDVQDEDTDYTNEVVQVPADDTDLSYDEIALPVPNTAAGDDSQDLSYDLPPAGDQRAYGNDIDQEAREPVVSDLPKRSREYQDPQAYSGANSLRVDSGGQEPAPRQSVTDDYRNRSFDRTEQIENNPLPRYDVARRNNIRATGRPGPQTLEGPQTPSLTIEKIAPTEIQVGKPAKFQIKVTNVGQVAADSVVIRDEVPEGTNFSESTPEARQDSNGGLVWEVGTIGPGEESVVTVELMPVEEGQVGSIATVAFEASATARARSTKPSLAIEHTAPRKVLVGEPVKFSIKLSNPGSGSATQIILDEDVPHGLSHSSGPKLEYEVGTILPGQTRHLELTLTAAQPGKVVNVLVARGDAGLLAKDTIELEVVAPEIQVNIDGPNRRYLEREATFTVSVANPGTATAKNVELVAQLPRGLRFLSTNNSGHYDQSRHAVIWNLEQLPAGEMGRAQFKAIPTEMGDFNVRAEATADRKLDSNEDHKLLVEGIAALYYGVADKIDPIEVGGETTYVITVENQGSKTANNIRFSAAVPDGMEAINGTGPTQATIRNQQVVFEPIVKLPPKAKTSFQIVVKGVRPGDQKLRVQMVSDDLSTPVIKEESTRVYTD